MLFHEQSCIIFSPWKALPPKNWTILRWHHFPKYLEPLFYFWKSWIVQLYILFGLQAVQYITCPQLWLFNLETPKHTHAQWANVPEMYQYTKNTIYLPSLTSFQTEIDFVELFDKFDPSFPVGLIGVPTVFLPVGGLAPNHPHLPGRP